MNPRSLFLTLAAFAALALPAFAQDPPPRKLKVRSIHFQMDKELPALFAHAVGVPEDTPGTPVEVKSYLNHKSEDIVLPGKNLIFTASSDPASSRKTEEIIATYSVPDRLRSVILVFVPGSGEEGKPPTRILAIDDTTKAFPPGSLKIMNLSPLPLRLQLEGKNFDFKPGDEEVVEDPPVNASNASGMLAFAFKEEQWQRIGAGIWPHPGSKRILQLAFFNPVSQQVEIRGILDIAFSDPKP